VSWIQTFTGRKFHPANPQPEQICIEDIAHALGLSCRFGGHCTEFMSVADHCVMMSHNVSDELAFTALMHDSAEAYLTDVPRPIKALLHDFMEFEDKVLEVIANKYKFVYPIPEEVKKADLMSLATERRDIMAPIVEEWGSLVGVEPFRDRICPNPPRFAEAAFLVRFKELCPDGVWL